MVYNGINFNDGYWKTKSEADFIEHEAHHGLSEAQLKEAFALMNPKPEKRVKESKPAETIGNKV